MDLATLYVIIKDFCRETHGSSDYYKDQTFVQGENSTEFAPLSYIMKKNKELASANQLLAQGMVQESYDLNCSEIFLTWYEKQFARKLASKQAREIFLLLMPNNERIQQALQTVALGHELLRKEKILLNGKKLPVQVGEWYAKCIFGLLQVKSTSQRGFDFYLDEKRVEVKVHWSDYSSMKGVKIRKSLVELSDYSIIIYVANNFLIREICFLDSEFVLRKFANKGHTLFLKDLDLNTYFFSKSTKHLAKVVNSTALFKFSTPAFSASLANKIPIS